MVHALIDGRPDFCNKFQNKSNISSHV